MILGLIYILFITYLMGKASSGIHSLDDFFGCLIGSVFMLGITAMVLSIVMPLQIASTLGFAIVAGILLFAARKRARNKAAA